MPRARIAETEMEQRRSIGERPCGRRMPRWPKATERARLDGLSQNCRAMRSYRGVVVAAGVVVP
jgi:hypothetical protein